MKFSYNWLKEYVPGVPDLKKLAGDLAMRAFEVEGVEQVGDDWALDIKVLPNRAFDCLSHLGLAREIAAIDSVKFKEPAVKVKEDRKLSPLGRPPEGWKIKDFLSVEVREPKLCPRYSGRVVIDLKVGQSPQWLKDRLMACGLRPINNVVDVTNFVMLECGQPLHAFDLDKIEGVISNVQFPPTKSRVSDRSRELRLYRESSTKSGSSDLDKVGTISKQVPNFKSQIKKIIVRRARKDERIITLDEGRTERLLDENTLVIADEKRAIGIAGIKGGRGPEIDDTTSRIALEAANFDAVNIRKSSRALALRTDASMRFENGVDGNLTLWALDRAASLIVELAGGKIVAGAIDISTIKIEPRNNGVAHSYVERLLGVEIKSSNILNIFQRLGLEKIKTIKKSKDIFYEVCIPSRRADLLTPEDLIEEIGRLQGYENIPSKMPSVILSPALKDEDLIYTEEIRDILVGLGYSDVYNYAFVSEKEKNLYGFNNLIKVLNPLSEEQKYLRPSLAVGLLRNLKENLRHWHAAHKRGTALRLFEVGRVFEQEKNKVAEKKKIGGILYLNQKDKNAVFYELKGAIEALFNKLALADVWEDSYLQKGLSSHWSVLLKASKTVQIKVGANVVGIMGEVGLGVSEAIELEGAAIIFEIDFACLIKLIRDERIYQPPSPFPAITRDLSILVPFSTKIEAIIYEIESAAGDLLADVDLFDLYEGEYLAEEQKSLAFHLIWQSGERNLTDVEVSKLMGKIIAALEGKGWEVRK